MLLNCVSIQPLHYPTCTTEGLSLQDLIEGGGINPIKSHKVCGFIILAMVNISYQRDVSML